MPMLFVVRRSSVRSIVNLDEVHSAIDAQPTLRGRVRYVSLETLSLTEQLAAVSSSRILIGAHGQGMVWSAMLPTGGHSPLTAPTFVSSSPAAERFAALELFPKQATTQHTHAWFDIRRKRHTRILHTHAWSQHDALPWLYYAIPYYARKRMLLAAYHSPCPCMHVACSGVQRLGFDERR